MVQLESLRMHRSSEDLETNLNKIFVTFLKYGKPEMNLI